MEEDARWGAPVLKTNATLLKDVERMQLVFLFAYIQLMEYSVYFYSLLFSLWVKKCKHVNGIGILLQNMTKASISQLLESNKTTMYLIITRTFGFSKII